MAEETYSTQRLDHLGIVAGIWPADWSGRTD